MALQSLSACPFIRDAISSRKRQREQMLYSIRQKRF